MHDVKQYAQHNSLAIRQAVADQHMAPQRDMGSLISAILLNDPETVAKQTQLTGSGNGWLK